MKSKVNIITIYKDPSCEMAKVKLNKAWIMEGNYWDFHPGCHGINTYGDFKGPDGLATAIASYLQKKGETVEIKRTTYK